MNLEQMITDLSMANLKIQKDIDKMSRWSSFARSINIDTERRNRIEEYIKELRKFQSKISKFEGITLIGYRKNDYTFIELSP